MREYLRRRASSVVNIATLQNSSLYFIVTIIANYRQRIYRVGIITRGWKSMVQK